MGTRSIIVVKQGNKVNRHYKHWDGYPTHNLEVIQDGIKAGPSIDDFTNALNNSSDYRANLEDSFTNKHVKDCLGNQGDLEWVYIVDLDSKDVSVYGGGYIDDVPVVAYQKGTVDPMSYVNCLIDSYQDAEGKVIQSHVESLNGLGFTVNGKNVTTPKNKDLETLETTGVFSRKDAKPKKSKVKATAVSIVHADLVKQVKNGVDIWNLDTGSYSVGLALKHNLKPTTVERCFRQHKNNKALKALYKPQ